MVKEVTAFQAEDGSTHATWEEAAKHDAAGQLKKLDIFNQGTIISVVSHAQQIVDALQPIIAGRPTEDDR